MMASPSIKLQLALFKRERHLCNLLLQGDFEVCSHHHSHPSSISLSLLLFTIGAILKRSQRLILSFGRGLVKLRALFGLSF